MRSGPGDGAGTCVREEGVVHSVDQNPHVGGGHLVWMFGSGSNFDWTSVMNAELTAENGPACITTDSVLLTRDVNRTHEGEGRVQVFIVFPRVIPAKLVRFPTAHGVEVGPRVVGSQRIEEFLV